MRCSRRISSNSSLVSMGRSLKGLVVYTRMGASRILSRVKARLSGGSRRDEAGSGSCAFGFTQIHADKSADERRSGLKAAPNITQADGMHARIATCDGETDSPEFARGAALSFDRRIGILRYGIDRRIGMLRYGNDRSIGMLRYDDNHSTYSSGAGVESTPPRPFIETEMWDTKEM